MEMDSSAAHRSLMAVPKAARYQISLACRFSPKLRTGSRFILKGFSCTPTPRMANAGITCF
jgi:hypothetical protein